MIELPRPLQQGSASRALTLATLLMLLVPLTLVSGSAASVTLQVDELEGAAGETTTVPIEVRNAAGIGALHVELNYDPDVVELQTVDKGELLTGSSLVDFTVPEPGRLIVGIATLDDIEGDGEVLVAEFKVTGEEEEQTDLALENARAWEGETRFDILVRTRPGRLTVTGGGLPLLYIVLALIALLLVLLVFLLARRRRPQAAVVTAGQPPYPYSQPTVTPPQTSQPPQPALPVFHTPPPVSQPVQPVQPVQPTPPPVSQPPTPVSQPAATAAGPAGFCTQCGNPLASDDLFCGRCGKRRPA